jgi:cytochrome c-type biogenesis protein CcmH/NrfG
MATHSGPTSSDAPAGLPANQVYGIAAICLLLGLFTGYFFLGKHAAPTVAPAHAAGNIAKSGPPSMGAHPKLTLEQMKQMADLQASTLIEKSKGEPKNADLPIQIARIYQASHQFKEAASYFEKALKIDPKNVSARTEMASSLYYSGDVDGAVSQLNQSLKFNPKDANSLFNLGMIKYQGKKDPAGAIAAWQQLLKTNPNLDRKPIVEQMIAEAKASTETKPGAETKN